MGNLSLWNVGIRELWLPDHAEVTLLNSRSILIKSGVLIHANLSDISYHMGLEPVGLSFQPSPHKEQPQRVLLHGPEELSCYWVTSMVVQGDRDQGCGQPVAALSSVVHPTLIWVLVGFRMNLLQPGLFMGRRSFRACLLAPVGTAWSSLFFSKYAFLEAPTHVGGARLCHAVWLWSWMEQAVASMGSPHWHLGRDTQSRGRSKAC